MEGLKFAAEYRDQFKRVFGRDASEEECAEAWQRELERERDSESWSERQRELEREERQRELEDQEREASVVRLIAEEPSLSDAEREQIVRAVRGDRQLILDIQGASASPHLWTLLASTGVHHARLQLVFPISCASAGYVRMYVERMDVEGDCGCWRTLASSHPSILTHA